jgi:type IV pilus assembly protein PilM
MKNMLAPLLGKKPEEQFVSVDIGTSSIKLMELGLGGGKPKLLNAACGQTPSGCISNNVVTKPDVAARVIRSLVEANDFKSTKAIVAIPGPAAFTKKVTMPLARLDELQNNIIFEASNYIPHKIDAVHFDFQVLRAVSGSNMEVLLVATKNEIIQSYLTAVEQAGFEPAIADIDYFALGNMFELNYPQEKKKTIGLVNIGARYSAVNIMQDGESLFTGDVGVGGRLYTDALCESLNMQPREADEAKLGNIPEGADASLVAETIARATEHIASELHRQLGFFWNAAATNRTIETIYLSGGGSQMPGLLEELRAKTNIECLAVDPFQQIDTASGFDADYLGEIAPQMAVSVGLALRRLGDKQHAIQ